MRKKSSSRTEMSGCVHNQQQLVYSIYLVATAQVPAGPFPPRMAHPSDHFSTGQSGSRGQYQEMAKEFVSFL